MPLICKSLLKQWTAKPFQESTSIDNMSPESIVHLSTNQDGEKRMQLRRVSDIYDYVPTHRKKKGIDLDATADKALNDNTSSGQESLLSLLRSLDDGTPCATRESVNSSFCSSEVNSSFRSIESAESQWSDSLGKTERRRSSILKSSSTSLKASKRVSFTDNSTLQLYEDDPTHRKSYTTKDEQLFQTSALLEAIRIRDAITSNPVEISNPVMDLIEQNLLSPEELIGIEQKVADNRGSRVIRRRHSAFLLQHQNELREKNMLDTETLALVAAASSSTSVAKAT